MRKSYQSREIDTNQPAVSETVSVALDELAADMREGLLALAVGAGLQPRSWNRTWLRRVGRGGAMTRSAPRRGTATSVGRWPWAVGGWR